MNTICKTIIACVIFFSMPPVFAHAHPPSKITITYDKASGVLNCVATHKVADPQKHFIKQMIITINKKIWMTKDFDRQTSQRTQEFSVPNKDIKPGDVISVEAECNLSGKLTKKTEIK